MVVDFRRLAMKFLNAFRHLPRRINNVNGCGSDYPGFLAAGVKNPSGKTEHNEIDYFFRMSPLISFKLCRFTGNSQ
jgi:hypothetical protein